MGASGASRAPEDQGPLLSVEEARARILAAVATPTEGEVVATIEARGRVLAAPVVSRTALPPWDNSAMDGYAIRAADVALATDESPVRLEVIGEVRAGQDPTAAVRRGTAIRIATGGRIPPGADAVVQVELTTPVDADGQIEPELDRQLTPELPVACLVHRAVSPGAAIRARGSDLDEGATILTPGTELVPAAVALAAGAGVSQLTVHRRPVVGVMATGDEVRSPYQDLGAAGIPDANTPGLVAQIEAAGGVPRVLGVAKDRLEDVRARLCAGLAEGVEAIIVSGGVSVGPYDVVKLAFEEVGTIDLWRVAVQPGKPFVFGQAERPDGGRALLFGLPGNPVSTFVTFELFVRPVLRLLGGFQRLDRQIDRAVLATPATKSLGRRGYLRVTVERDAIGSPVRDAAGRVRAALAGDQGSHVLSGLAAADALAVIPEAARDVPAGTEVALWWLDRA